MSVGPAVAVAVLLLALNAFFVGAEFAVVSARRSSVEPLAAAGSARARTALWAMEHVSLMLACAQLGITVASVSLAIVVQAEVRQMAAKAGLSVERAETAVATLQGDDLHQIASQARQAQNNLAGGASTIVISTTTIIIVLLVIILIVLIAD